MKRWNPVQVVDGDKAEDNMVELSQYYKAVKYPLSTYFFEESFTEIDNVVYLPKRIEGRIIA